MLHLLQLVAMQLSSQLHVSMLQIPVSLYVTRIHGSAQSPQVQCLCIGGKYVVFCATIQYAIMVVNNIGHTITAGISMRCVTVMEAVMTSCLYICCLVVTGCCAHCLSIALPAQIVHCNRRLHFTMKKTVFCCYCKQSGMHWHSTSLCMQGLCHGCCFRVAACRH